MDHVVARLHQGSDCAAAVGADTSNPFERHRDRFSAWALARAHRIEDEEYLEILRRLDGAVARIDGEGFRETPFSAESRLARALGFEETGRLLVKDETGNVSGSHKARHLFGIMLYLQVAERVGTLATRPALAIASCGNAALAAAVVARAADWPLDVFVPASANPAVLSRLEVLGARITICRRSPGEAGDPCYLAFRRAIDDGAIPFCCQGSDNGLTIEGGETLAWEMTGVNPAEAGSHEEAGVDAIFVQVGGGALASAVVRGFEDERRRGATSKMPRVYAVQTAGGYPLVRAYDRLVARMVAEWPSGEEPASGAPASVARALAGRPALIDAWMAFARRHRSLFMWPWQEEPRSIAHGILDDETYDWAAVVEGMLRTGGRPVVVSEECLRTANRLARSATGIDVDHTGSAGLAGLMTVLEQEPNLRRERVAVIFSGVRR